MDFNIYLLALKQRCNGYNDVYLPFYMRYFYTVKLIVCLLLNRELTVDTLPELYTPDFMPYEDSISVCFLSSGSSPDYYAGGTIHWWNDLHVGRGVLSEWFYFENVDST